MIWREKIDACRENLNEKIYVYIYIYIYTLWGKWSFKVTPGGL
jgi:hypothetical protein